MNGEKVPGLWSGKNKSRNFFNAIISHTVTAARLPLVVYLAPVRTFIISPLFMLLFL
jgi:hypothetical protein